MLREISSKGENLIDYELAHVVFLSTGNLKEASLVSGIPLQKLKKWSEENNWEADRRYVDNRIREMLREKVLQWRTKRIQLIAERIEEILEFKFDDAKVGSIKDLAIAIKELGEYEAKLLGYTESEEQQAPQQQTNILLAQNFDLEDLKNIKNFVAQLKEDEGEEGERTD